MSSPERRKELAAIHEREAAERDAERRRRANLSMYARIEEFVDDEELKRILHDICERVGLQD